MKISSLALSAAFLAGMSGLAMAQDTRAAPGVPAPNTPRVESNGDVSPPPSRTVTGGVGATEETGGTPGQTRSGGPAGGKGPGGGS